MRPLAKWAVGFEYLPGHQIPQTFSNHADAAHILSANLGKYCSYCERYDPGIQIDHVVPVTQKHTPSNAWDNLLYACSTCNRFKWHAEISEELMFLPHKSNTAYLFVYFADGTIIVNPEITDDITKAKAEKLLKVTGLDQIFIELEDTPKEARDSRDKDRRKAWKIANDHLKEYESGKESYNINGLVNFAKQRGSFSVWFTVFQAHSEVRKALIEGFKGTNDTCFDPQNGYNPMPI
ncbi:MAG: HNH endonuclease signature motif containing protein [Bacteroidota bacterium]